MAKLTKRVSFFRALRKQKKSASVKFAPIKVNIQKNSKQLVIFAERKPLTSFFIILFVLFVLIAGGNFLRKPKLDLPPGPVVKSVDTFKIGSSPLLTFEAQVEKSGVLQITAQTSGVVNRVNFGEGDKVWRGSTLISLSSNYTGANALSVQKKLAQVQHENVIDTFDLQREIIGKQREIAKKTDSNSDELREIADKSLGETRDLISLNEDIISSIDSNISSLEAGNSGGVNDELILQSKQLKSQFLSANNLAKASLKNSELSADDEKPQAELSDLGKEVALKQLEHQEKALELSRESSELGLRLASISESLMFPASPFDGVIERVHVRKGQIVQPGTPLVTITGADKTISAVVLVPASIAKKVSFVERSSLYIGNRVLETLPSYVSGNATNGQLYSVIYSIPIDFTGDLTDKSFVKVDIPIGLADTSASIPFIPIDSIFQTQDSAFVFLVNGEKAASKEIRLGSVNGSYVEVIDGLIDSDQVILNRNVLDGDRVKVNET